MNINHDKQAHKDFALIYTHILSMLFLLDL